MYIHLYKLYNHSHLHTHNLPRTQSNRYIIQDKHISAELENVQTGLIVCVLVYREIIVFWITVTMMCS